MNLPNCYIADQPPEATLSPAMVSAACDAVRRNRRDYLAGLPVREIVATLCDVGRNWLQPECQYRRIALERGPAESGYSRATLQRGLDGFFREFTPENFDALLAQEFGGDGPLQRFTAMPGERRLSMAVTPELIAHVCAGNVPNPSLMSVTLGLLLRSAQFVKCASGASLLPRLFAHALREADPKLGGCIEVAEWRGGDAELENALFAAADCVTATGSDETLAGIHCRLPSGVPFLGYGYRVSFGLVTREALHESSFKQVISAAADDVTAWDQHGCLSPHVIYVEEGGAVDAEGFAEKLAVELAESEMREPRGIVSTEEAAGIASRRAAYETIAALRNDVKLWQSRGSTAWTVVFEQESRFKASCLNRFIYIKPVAGLSQLLEAVDVVHGKVSTVGIAAPEPMRRELAVTLARWGVTRICPLGQMQNPPLTWRHDGRPLLGDLVCWTDFEL